MSGAYPSHLVADVALRDGRTVRIRPARPEDRERVEDYLIGLSEETLRLRFGSASIDVREVSRRAVDVDHVSHLTLLATTGEDERVVGGAQYVRIDGGRAEIGVSVADELQGLGLGSLLVGSLAQAAAERGIHTLVAEVLPENHRMIDVFRRSGFPVAIRARAGTIEVELATALTEEAAERFEEREARAAAAAVRTFLAPRSVAVIGASRDPASIGGRLFANLIRGNFAGAVHPVNPKAAAVQGVRAYPSVLDVPGPVDVAFVVVPAAAVLEVAEECARKGVRGLVVISAGFGETGGEGRERERRLLEICRRAGMRLIGPNCMGIVNTDPEVSLDGTFASVSPPPGRVGFLSQSGALGLAVMAQAARLGLGLSSFVSVGNKADISGNDLLAYWDADPRTDVILLYLESFGNPRRFARLARRIGRRKPIVAVKSGRSKAGARAASSHTGALLQASDVTVDALFHQAGVIRTDTLEEMFDVATLLANQPPPGGDGVGIVTNAGGLGILCADTCEANGLQVPPLAEETVRRLREVLPSEASVQNPVDMIASASGADYAAAIRIVAEDPGVDAIVVIYIPPLEQQAPEVARGIVDGIAAAGGRVPILTTYMSARGLPEELRGADGFRVPSYAFPEQAAIALARAAAYGRWRARPEGRVPRFPDLRADEAAGVIAGALARGPGWLLPEEVDRLLRCAGLPTPEGARAATPEEAGEAAARIGGRVALKAVGPLHKTDVGGVVLDLEGAERVEREARAMAERVRAAGQPLEGFLVQRMVPPGVEMLVGVAQDRLFGPVVACSAGGTAVELLRDVAVRIAPLTDLDAAEMVRSLRTFPLLEGYRGAPRADVAALEEVILRVSALVDELPAIAEMDCNPVVVLPQGAFVVDARVRVEEPPRPPLPAARGS